MIYFLLKSATASSIENALTSALSGSQMRAKPRFIYFPDFDSNTFIIFFVFGWSPTSFISFSPERVFFGSESISSARASVIL